MAIPRINLHHTRKSNDAKKKDFALKYKHSLEKAYIQQLMIQKERRKKGQDEKVQAI